MTSRRRWLAPALCLACLAARVEAQEKVTERTLKLAPGAKSPEATLADMAWLAGHWVGPALGGESEEIWSPPKAGSMMVMYRLVRDGKPVFYEFQTLVEVGGSLVLRLGLGDLRAGCGRTGIYLHPGGPLSGHSYRPFLFCHRLDPQKC